MSLRRSLCLAATLAVALPLAVQATALQSTAVDSVSQTALSPTRLQDFQPFLTQGLLENQLSMAARYTVLVDRVPFNDRLPGEGKARGKAIVNSGCASRVGATTNLGKKKGRFDTDSGRAIVASRLDANRGCYAVFAETTLSGNQEQPVGSTVTVTAGLQLLPNNADPDCFTANTLCLNGGRFKVHLDWQDVGGEEGPSVGFPVTDNSGYLYFFDPDNTELRIQILDGCGVNGSFWVFYGSLTDVAFELTVTDTETSVVKTYFNPLGEASPAITDTSAFATCP
jgi:hypothetical protein